MKKTGTKYLVTGACGFIGSHICDVLQERGLDFRATDMENAPRSYLPSGADFMACDLTKPETIKPVLEGIDIVLHPAGIFNWFATRELLEAVNVRGMENLCAAAKAAGVKRLVSWSTSGVYGSQEFDTLPIREDFHQEPIEDYSITKQMQDRIAMRYNDEEGLPTSIIRPGIVYGSRSKYGAAQIFEIFAALPIVPIPINFKYRFGTVHARDIAGAAIFVSGKKEAEGQVYGVVDCSDITMADFFRVIAKAFDKPALPLIVPPMLSRHAGLFAADIAEWVARNITKSAPLLERGPIQFFPVDLYISNKKLLDLGYNFEFPTPEEGIVEVMDWMDSEGMLDTNIIELLAKMTAK